MIVVNKKARFLFHIHDTYTAGIVLQGSEIKSIRAKRVGVTEAFCQFKQGELYVVNLFIDTYKEASYLNHEPKRTRKLLLNKQELRKLEKKVKERGRTVAVLDMHMNEKGFAKLTIGLAEGKKLFDKREDIKRKDLSRQENRRIKM